MISGTAALALDSTEITDEELVPRIVGGETALFELLMRRHNERIYRAARAITRDDAEAEDVMQQAYLNAFAHLGQFNGQAQFSTWLTRIAVHESLARVRRLGRYTAFDEEEQRGTVEAFMRASDNPEQATATAELREVLEWAVDRIPDGAREVFVLRDVEGLSTSETAAALGVSDDVVKTRLSRARAALRRLVLERTGASITEVFRFYRPRCDRVVSRVMAKLPAQ